MSEEDFRKELEKLCHSGAEKAMDITIDEFFESNVCIPKGENRHKYADVIHAYAEGGEVEVNVNTNLQPKWYKFALGHKYRIKPSEPICEWQWALVLNTVGEIGRTTFMTQKEFNENFPPEQGIYWSLDTKTKRVRT